jgi:MoaA/NifB/PqqE/SkfB family radical SAM enzyme
MTDISGSGLRMRNSPTESRSLVRSRFSPGYHDKGQLTATSGDVGPTFPHGWKLAPMMLGFILSFVKYALQRKKYPHFKLKSLRTIHNRKLIAIRRYAKLGEHYFGTTMRIPRWPSQAFDHMVANGGLNIEPELIKDKHQIDSVIIAITRKCTYDCEHCYAYTDRSDEDAVPVDRWIEVVRQIQDVGASVIVLSGGEPMVRFGDMIEILRSADKSLSDFHLHTSGKGMSLQRARELKDAGLVAAGIGLDYPDAERHDRFRGQPGAFRDATNALEDLRRAGLFTYTNVCLQKDLLNNGALRDHLDLARRLRVGTIQLLEPKPSGRYEMQEPDHLFSDEDRRSVTEFFAEVNQSDKYKDYPPVAYTAYYERPENFGCLMGGFSHLSIDGSGNVNPCVFVPVSFGNILNEDFSVIYKRMRATISQPIRRDCASLLLRQTIARRRAESRGAAVPYNTIRQEWDRVLSA